MSVDRTTLAIAVSCGKTKWRKEFISVNLPLLIDGSLSPQAFADLLQAEFDRRHLTELHQQKDTRSNITQAIKAFDPQHPAIALVSPTTQEYQELYARQQLRLAQRQTGFIQPESLDKLITSATKLLSLTSPWYDVAAGIAVLTGRRVSEILLSDFTIESAWILNISRYAKKKDNTQIIEFPTLAPATKILTAIKRLQQELPIEKLLATTVSFKDADTSINALYSPSIATACDRHFQNLIPPRQGKTNLYTHLFRAVYTTIATHWFCPVSVPEHQYKAAIQGHFTVNQDRQKIANYSARAYYDDYAIADRDGNKDGRLGIKLDSLADFRQISQFTPPSSISSDLPFPLSGDEHPTPPELSSEDHLDPTDHLEQLSLPQLDRDASWEQILSIYQWFVTEINSLRPPSEFDRLLQENDRLQQQLADRTVENQLLQEQLAEARQLLDAIAGMSSRPVASTSPTPNLTPAQPTSEERLAHPPVSPATLEPISVPSKTPSTAKIDDIINAIVQWNLDTDRPSRRVRISHPAIKVFARLLNTNTQSAIDLALKLRADDLQRHHQDLFIGSRANKYLPDRDTIFQSIARDYLHLHNWQDVKF